MDFYDKLIENTIEEWISMSRNTEEAWEQPKFSKKKVEKAGKTLANKDVSAEEREQALEILNNWRSSHAYPLQVIADDLRDRHPDTMVVQRLKRLDSIEGKLKRFPEMSLYKMQDLGGCRVIVDTIEEVYDCVFGYQTSKMAHKFKKDNDYIEFPKDSGYRSYHMVYQFQDSFEGSVYNKGMFIEIQVRTKLQHIWATALEVMGVYTKLQLKASMGDKDILRFFVLVSSIFAQKEGTPICPNTEDDYDTLVAEIKEIDEKHNVISRLSAISVVINKKFEKEPTKGYYLLQLDFNKRVVNVKEFNSNEISLATKIYNKMEAQNDPNLDVVLVSASSFEMVKDAYPNYFADISEFVEIMRGL